LILFFTFLEECGHGAVESVISRGGETVLLLLVRDSIGDTNQTAVHAPHGTGVAFMLRVFRVLHGACSAFLDSRIVFNVALPSGCIARFYLTVGARNDSQPAACSSLMVGMRSSARLRPALPARPCQPLAALP
jgi:hypothetical protein